MGGSGQSVNRMFDSEANPLQLIRKLECRFGTLGDSGCHGTDRGTLVRIVFKG